MTPLGPYYPFLGAFLGIGTVALSYHLTASHGHLPPGSSTPPISLLGCNAPEKYAYQIGFSLTGLVLLRCVAVEYSMFIYPSLASSYPSASRCAYAGGIFAAIGAAGQGLVTMEEDFFANVSSGRGPSPQSVLHQLLALVFFMGAACHCYATVYMCLRSGGGGGVDDSSIRSPLRASKAIKLLCAGTTFISWPIAEALHPLVSRDARARPMDIGGIAQYVTVGAYILFFGSYSLDLLRIRKSSRKAD